MTENIVAEPLPTLEGPIATVATIVSVNLRTSTFHDKEQGRDVEATYIDFALAPQHEELASVLGGNTINVGYPFRLSPDTALGQFCSRLGEDPTKAVDFTGAFQGREVLATFDKKPNSKGEGLFWRADRDSIQLPPSS